MLLRLRASNFAIIDNIEVEFKPGFSVLSGETGAGKSILIDALIFAMGAKASADILRTGADQAEVEAVFAVNSKSAAGIQIEELGLAEGEELILRRQYGSQGKSRSWVNSKSASLSMLFQLAGKLVDIYGQHDYQTLLAPEQHLNFLDEFAGTWQKFKNYPELFAHYQSLVAEYARLSMSDQERKEREDFLKFRISELERSNLTPGEEPELETERERLKHSELLRKASESGHKELYLQDGSIAEKISRVQTELEKASAHDPSLARLAKELSDARGSVEEIGRELGAYLQKLESDPGRLEEIEERLAEIRSLKRKYHAEVPELTALLMQSKKELEELGNYEYRSGEMKAGMESARQKVLELARELSKERKSRARTLSKNVEQMLSELGMEKSKFEVRFEPLAEPSPNGIDLAEFFISPNPGEELKPLSKIASGGELSRIMLALRGILAGKVSAPVLIFDEVDAGIGGAVAEVVGKKLKSLSSKNQVLCVTHLAQIARFADHHYQVFKRLEKGRTVTRIRELGREDRVEELARMLGGVKITDKTRAYAREMLEENQS